MNYHHLFILINILYTIYSFKCGHNIIKKPEIKIINQTNEENNKSRKLSFKFTLIMKYYCHK